MFSHSNLLPNHLLKSHLVISHHEWRYFDLSLSQILIEIQNVKEYDLKHLCW